jgi:hypothetical protein
MDKKGTLYKELDTQVIEKVRTPTRDEASQRLAT